MAASGLMTTIIEDPPPYTLAYCYTNEGCTTEESTTSPVSASGVVDYEDPKPPPYEEHIFSYNNRLPYPMVYPNDPPPIATHQPQEADSEVNTFWVITLSCIVTWCCGLLFGVVAFVLAVIASTKSANGENRLARLYATTSLAVSIAGVLMGVVLYSVLIAIYLA